MPTRERWNAAWAALGLDPPEGTHEELLSSYGEPQRGYHDLRHLEECFRALDSAPSTPHRPEIELALWFHDGIYDPHRSDNEKESARWAERSLLAAGADGDTAARVRDLILATEHTATPCTGDAALLVDIDLSILAADTPRFDEYERQVREEYQWVPEPLFRQNRARILRGFLARPSIFATEHFRARFEEAARDNIARSLARLEGGIATDS